MINIGKITLKDFPLLLAPMEDVSDPPFRAVCKRYGADLLFTEFISSEGLIRDAIACRRKLEIFEEERPVGIQIFGGDEERLAMAAQIVEAVEPDFLDINFGCPIKGIVGRGAGAGVLKDIPQMIKLTASCIKATRLPVTVKTRLGWDDASKNIEEVALRLQDAGIAALTIHGRTRSQLYKGAADWTLIGKIKNDPRIKIPIFGNGDIDSPQKALEYKDRYGVDGIMVGRAAIGYPWIFREIRHLWRTGELHAPPTLEERLDVCRLHLRASIKWQGQIGLYEMRGRYAQYLKGLPELNEHRKKLVMLSSPEEIEEALDDIGRAYRGLEMGRQPIELVNYHEKCTL